MSTISRARHPHAVCGAPLFTEGDLRRAIIVAGLERAGLRLEDLAREMREGRLSLAFVDEPGFDVFADLSGQTFAELARDSGIPLGLLSVLREATGFAQPEAGDAVRSVELKVVTLILAMLDAGVPEAAVERTLRTYGDSARRLRRRRMRGSRNTSSGRSSDPARTGRRSAR